MKDLKGYKPLRAGDKVAAISLSWGGAGDEALRWRYEQGKRQLKDTFGLEVVEMPHTLKGTKYVYDHPEDRAADLMAAFRDPSIKAILSTIGGIESVRIAPFIDYEVIRNNPKPYIGYSDSTTTHLMCFKAGVTSIYGGAILVDFAENNGVYSYTVDHMKRTLFDEAPVGNIESAREWTSQILPWEVENKDISRTLQKEAHGYEVLQGKGKVTGRLLGGCLEVFDTHRGTDLFPSIEDFDDAILFFETSEDKPPAWFIETVLRTYGNIGILHRIRGMIWGKPQDETNYDAYKVEILKVFKEFHLEAIPILYNVNFGHTEPKICLPYGGEVTIDCDKATLYAHY